MRNKRMVIALITAAVLLMTGFVFADSLSERDEAGFNGYRNDGSFGHMRGFGWNDDAPADGDWDEERFDENRNDGFFGHMRGFGWNDEAREDGYGFGHCYFGDEDWEDGDFEAYREEWLNERFSAIDEAVEAGEITEEEALDFKETLEERSEAFEEEGSFRRGPGMGPGMGRGRGGSW